MANVIKIRCIRALKGLKQLMDLYDEIEDEQPKRKTLQKTSQESCEKNNVTPNNVTPNPYVTPNNVTCNNVTPNNETPNDLMPKEIEEQVLKDVAWKSNDDEETFCPMSMGNYEELIAVLEPEVRKSDESVYFNKSSFRIRVATTLRYLIKGESYRTLGNLAHLSRTTVSYVLPKTLNVLIDVLEKTHLKVPTTENEWLGISNDFQTFWEFPHALGVIDGKNIFSKASAQPKKTSGLSSIQLLSVLDAHSRFIHIDIINSDSVEPTDAYKNSAFYQGLTTKTFNIPAPQPLDEQIAETRYSFLGDSAFGMDPYIIKAYDDSRNLSDAQKTFNQKLKRARFPADMAFEILFYRFKIFERTEKIDVETCSLVIKACCLLHNFLTQNLNETVKIEDKYDETLKLPKSMSSIPTQSHEECNDAFETRNNICKYYSTEDLEEQWIMDIIE